MHILLLVLSLAIFSIEVEARGKNRKIKTTTPVPTQIEPPQETTQVIDFHKRVSVPLFHNMYMQEEKDDKDATLVMNKTLIYGPSLTTRHLVHIILVSLIYPNRRLFDN